jgi:hypothetical protein
MFRRRHLQEERLLDCYFADRAGDAIDPPSAEHLADCPACTARYSQFARFMDDVRAQADAEADAAFPAERLRQQRSAIARKIEHLAHPARVITFPGQTAARTPANRRTRFAPRWLVAAVAAGLVIGVSVGYIGSSFQTARRNTPIAGQAFAVRQSPPIVSQPIVLDQSAATSADEFLLELEMAAEGPRTHELLALDELTPHVREVRVRTSLR